MLYSEHVLFFLKFTKGKQLHGKVKESIAIHFQYLGHHPCDWISCVYLPVREMSDLLEDIDGSETTYRSDCAKKADRLCWILMNHLGFYINAVVAAIIHKYVLIFLLVGNFHSQHWGDHWVEM